MINEIVLTAVVMAMAVACVFAIGVCVSAVGQKLFRVEGTSAQFYAAVPLVGTGAIILFCQNLLYLDVRITYLAMAIWVCVLAYGIAAAARGRLILRNIPWGLFATGLIVYLVHASGLIASGVSNYYGYGWSDMFNYVAQAQFFIDFPYSQIADSHEYVRVANGFKADRIGQTVLHAFISASTGADAQRTFGATILLSPMLIFFSTYLLSIELNIQRCYAYPSAIVAALSPAIAAVHLECFFSQAMAMPFVFLWPSAIARLKVRPSAQSILIAALLWAVTSAIYTELIPLMTLIAAIVLIAPNLHTGQTIVQSLRSGFNVEWVRTALVALFHLVLVVAVGLLANVGYYKGAMIAMARTTIPGVLDVIYPWAFKSEGLARLWIGHQRPSLPELEMNVLALASAVLFVAAILYGITLHKRGDTSAPLFSVLLACVPLAPLLLSILTRNVYPYQFFKLLLTVWPLILLLGICGISEWISRIRTGGYFVFFQISLLGISLGLTTGIAYASSKVATTATSARGASHLLIDSSFRQIRMALDSLEGRQIYIWWYDNALWDGTWRGRWMGYFARKNTVWSMKLIDSTVPGQFFESLPPNGVELPAVGISWLDINASIKARVGTSDAAGPNSFWLYELTDETEARRIDKASRSHGVVSRSMRLNVVKAVDRDKWYPIWVAGKPGAATLLTINYGKSGTSFRYDHWGYRATILTPSVACMGSDLRLSISIDWIGRKLSLNCNEASVAGTMPVSMTYLSVEDVLGKNEVASTLEGKYPLEKTFPGLITELPVIPK